MDGGIIDGNTAGSCGGGLFIQAGISTSKDGDKGESKAHISAGQITNNRTMHAGATNDYFGGGGIYVNGFREAGFRIDGTEYYGANGELHLKNAIIRENKSTLEGGGLGACPISKTIFHINDGVAIYNNAIGNTGAEGKGRTVYMLSSLAFGAHSGSARYKLSKRMLGGAPYNWIKFTDEGAFPLSEDDYKETELPQWGKLTLNSSDEANALTAALGKVLISGNTAATRGGGIGSNGTVIFGTDKKPIDIPVRKVWRDKNNAEKIRPDAITVELIAIYESEEYVLETRELNEANGWKAMFESLPTESAGKPITYRVKEIEVAGYKPQSRATNNADLQSPTKRRLLRVRRKSRSRSPSRKSGKTTDTRTNVRWRSRSPSMQTASRRTRPSFSMRRTIGKVCSGVSPRRKTGRSSRTL